MQPEYQTVEQTHERLLTMIRSRRDTGFKVAVSDALLEPRNPFDQTKRGPKTAIAVGAALSLLLLLVFAYFSLHSWK
jgi:type VI protein secretion system component VasF